MLQESPNKEEMIEKLSSWLTKSNEKVVAPVGDETFPYLPFRVLGNHFGPTAYKSAPKLSAAMRLGCKETDQCFGTMFGRYPNFPSGTEKVQPTLTCALGAAAYAYDFMVPLFVDTTYVDNPVTGERGDLVHMLVVLNDTYRWTREAIADWLEDLGY